MNNCLRCNNVDVLSCPEGLLLICTVGIGVEEQMEVYEDEHCNSFDELPVWKR